MVGRAPGRVSRHHRPALLRLGPMAKGLCMRNVITTNSASDVSEEYAEQVNQLLKSLRPERETTMDNEPGQSELYVRLYTYEEPGTSETMWAVDYSDPASRELEETASGEEAVARYEEFVRDAADLLGIDGDGLQERFTTTDVAGVPGPLPDLPEVTADMVEKLLDEPGAPVLYLARAEDDEDDDVIAQIGQSAWVDKRHVVLTREHVLGQLGLEDGQTPVTSAVASRRVEMYKALIGFLAHTAEKAAPAAADSLFPVPAA